ncbi:MAG: rhomboid family intramembrane serine protease [Chitinophagia bacterium]|nr:rhomboid family intramembrane serine protease [Chitinophagia bacterium]
MKRTQIAPYKKNAAMQLIVATGTGFIIFHFTRVVMLILGVTGIDAMSRTASNTALPEVHQFPHVWWTLFSYAWVHIGFWEWVTNMIWAYTFAQAIQNLVGYKQVIPIFVYGILIGGLCFLGIQLLPFQNYMYVNWMLGSYAGVMALGVAILTLSPKHKFYVGDQIAIPMYVVVLIYAALSIGNFYTSLPKLALLGSAALSGFLYVKLLRRGIPIGTWVYDLFSVLEAKTINQEQQALKEIEEKKSALDILLDKIHESGMESLSAKEKEQLKELSQS